MSNTVLLLDKQRYLGGGGRYRNFRFGTEERRKLKIL